MTSLLSHSLLSLLSTVMTSFDTTSPSGNQQPEAKDNKKRPTTKGEETGKANGTKNGNAPDGTAGKTGAQRVDDKKDFHEDALYSNTSATRNRDLINLIDELTSDG